MAFPSTVPAKRIPPKQDVQNQENSIAAMILARGQSAADRHNLAMAHTGREIKPWSLKDYAAVQDYGGNYKSAGKAVKHPASAKAKKAAETIIEAIERGDPTEEEQTDALVEQQANVESVIDQLLQDIDTKVISGKSVPKLKEAAGKKDESFWGGLGSGLADAGLAPLRLGKWAVTEGAEQLSRGPGGAISGFATDIYNQIKSVDDEFALPGMSIRPEARDTSQAAQTGAALNPMGRVDAGGVNLGQTAQAVAAGFSAKEAPSTLKKDPKTGKPIPGTGHVASFMDIYGPEFQEEIPALRPNENDAWWQRFAKQAPAMAASIATETALDPTTYLSGGTAPVANIGYDSVKAISTADDLVRAKKAEGIAANIARQADDEARLLKEEAITARKLPVNPLHPPRPEGASYLPEGVFGELGPGVQPPVQRPWARTPQVTRDPRNLPAVIDDVNVVEEAEAAAVRGGHVMYNADEAAKRIAEADAGRINVNRIKDAADPGYKALQTEIKAQARKVSTVASRAKRGVKGADAELDAAKATHSALLERLDDATDIRRVNKFAPVGSAALLKLESRAKRFTALAADYPSNKLLASKAAKATKELEAAKLADLPNSSARILAFVDSMRQGKNVKFTSQLAKDIVAASPATQAKVVATAEAAALTGPSAIPQSVAKEIMAAVNKAEVERLRLVADKETLASAAENLRTPSNYSAQGVSRKLIEENVARGRKLSKVEREALATKEGAALLQMHDVQEAALPAVKAAQKEAAKSSKELLGQEAKQAIYDEVVAQEVLPQVSEIDRYMDAGLNRRIAIRFLRKDLGEFEAVGKILRSVYAPFELVGKKVHGKGFSKMFRMGAHFPGETETIRRMAESYGVARHHAFTAEVRQVFQHVTRDESISIRKAIEAGRDMTGEIGKHGVDLGEVQQFVIRKTEEIFQEQMKYDKYLPGEKMRDYVYHYYRSRDKDAIAAFKADRAAVIKSGGKAAGIETAKSQGLKPMEHIDDMLLMHHRDFVRDLQRTNFRQQVMSRYGVLTDNAAYAQARGYVEVANTRVNKVFKDASDAKNARWYLPPELNKTFKAMDDLMKIGYHAETNAFMRAYDKFMRGFKTSATIGNPGNWTNNTFGDFFMNFIDGVFDPNWYRKSFGLLRNGEEEFPKTVKIAGRDMPGDDLMTAYRQNAPSGAFIQTEGGALTRRKLPRKVQSAYEVREDWVRLAHFLHATDQETKLAMKGGRTFEQAVEIAYEKAAKRVAKWNIDYTSITPFERKLRRTVVPFYTFMRKAAPLMLEAMILRPGKINFYKRTQRTLEQGLVGGPIEGDDEVIIPDYMQHGINRMGSGREPNVIREMAPLNVLDRIFGGDTPRDVLHNQLNVLSPGIKIPLEMAQGETVFNQRPVTNWWQWGASQLPSASLIARAIGQPLESTDTDNPDRSGLEMGANALGIPISRLTHNRQQAALRQQIGNKDEVFSQVNEAIKPYRITKSGNKAGDEYWVLGNSEDDSFTRRFKNYNDAVVVASKLLG